MIQNKSLISQLFDFSFSTFVTPRVVSIAYILVLVNVAFSTLNTIRLLPNVGFVDGIALLVTSMLNLMIYANCQVSVSLSPPESLWKAF